MIEPFIKQKGLFIFSDPGGAKGILSLAKTLKEKGAQEQFIYSDRVYDFYSDFHLSVDSATSTEIGNVIEQIQPDFIFTGTSYTSSIEIESIRCAREKDIKSYSFVDHWTNLKNRFVLNGTPYYPDEIWLIDERAANIAEQEGIPKDIIRISDNFYYTFLKTWQPYLSKHELLEKLLIPAPSNSKLILYAPEPISNIGGVEKFGFDETTVLQVLIESLNQCTTPNFLLIKPHPNQKRAFTEVLAAANRASTTYKLLGQTNTNDLIYFSDCIIGISSNLLIEASLMGKKIIRFFPPNYSDPLSHLHFGKKVGNQEELLNAIEALLLA